VYGKEQRLCRDEPVQASVGVVYFFDAVPGEPLTEHLLVELAGGRDRRADRERCRAPGTHSLRASQGLMPCIPAWVVVASNE